MSASEIIDYIDNKNEILHWINLKGETKYNEFLKLFKENGIALYWEKVKDTYRYDKRLLINCFKYLSFFEEYLRALIWNNSNSQYKSIEKLNLSEIIEHVFKQDGELENNLINLEVLKTFKKQINHLRNHVSHNKILLTGSYDGEKLEVVLNNFKRCLPIDYQKGFVEDINNCIKCLNVPDKFKIELN